jgi:hydroxymethylglutaryl-CoA lyase
MELTETKNHKIHLVECPRDAMQGWSSFIPTAKKIDYLNQLLKVGFDTLDFGSFVSPKAIPQMADTEHVLRGLDLTETNTRLLAIVANLRGADTACSFDAIQYLGFPFSISPTFQKLNANNDLEGSFNLLRSMQETCVRNNKSLVVYISMAFGNPYGDDYHSDLVSAWTGRILELGVKTISLADTVGLASPEQVFEVTQSTVLAFPAAEIGVHLHATHEGWREKLEGAYRAGCKRFDGAIKGIGGCPMAGNALVGNMNTAWMLNYFTEKGINNNWNLDAFKEAEKMADQIFLGNE